MPPHTWRGGSQFGPAGPSASPHPDLLQRGGLRGLTLAGGSGSQQRGPSGLGGLGRPGALLPGAALGGPGWAGGWVRRQQGGRLAAALPGAAGQSRESPGVRRGPWRGPSGLWRRRASVPSPSQPKLETGHMWGGAHQASPGPPQSRGSAPQTAPARGPHPGLKVSRPNPWSPTHADLRESSVWLDRTGSVLSAPSQACGPAPSPLCLAELCPTHEEHAQAREVPYQLLPLPSSDRKTGRMPFADIED